jgi:hypothetical protein
MELRSSRTPVLIGKSGARVLKVRREDGVEWLEKLGASDEISLEVAVLKWCRPWLPVSTVLNSEPGVVAMSVLPGVNLTEGIDGPRCGDDQRSIALGSFGASRALRI